MAKDRSIFDVPPPTDETPVSEPSIFDVPPPPRQVTQSQPSYPSVPQPIPGKDAYGNITNALLYAKSQGEPLVDVQARMQEDFNRKNRQAEYLKARQIAEQTPGYDMPLGPARAAVELANETPPILRIPFDLARGIGAAGVTPARVQINPETVNQYAKENLTSPDMARTLLEARGAIITPEAPSAPGLGAALSPVYPFPADITNLAEANLRRVDTQEARDLEAAQMATVPSFLRGTVAGLRASPEQLETSALYAGSVLGGGDDTRAALERHVGEANALQEARASQMGTANKLVSATVSNLVPMLLASPLGAEKYAIEGGAAIAQAALSTAGQTYADLKNQGVPEDEARRKAVEQAVAEAGPAAIMSKLGAGGVESLLSKKVADTTWASLQRGLPGVFKRSASTVGKELPEELVTTDIQSGLAGDSDKERQRAQFDTLAQTLAMSTAAQGQSEARRGIAKALGTQDQEITPPAAQWPQETPHAQGTPRSPIPVSGQEGPQRQEKEPLHLRSNEPDRAGEGQPPQAAVAPVTPPAPAPAATPAQPPPTTGLQPFAPETGTLGIPRAEMPQVKGSDRAEMLAHLKTQGVESDRETIAANALKPTQAEFDPAKIGAAHDYSATGREIIVSSDNHIVDGHHQWLAAMQDNPMGQIPVIRIQQPIREALASVAAFPKARTTTGTVPPAAAPKAAPAQAGIIQQNNPAPKIRPSAPISIPTQPTQAPPVSGPGVNRTKNNRAGQEPSGARPEGVTTPSDFQELAHQPFRLPEDADTPTKNALKSVVRALGGASTKATIHREGADTLRIRGPRGAEIKVKIASQDDLASIQASAQQQGAKPGQSPNGWYEKGTIHLVPNAAGGFTFNHEAIHAFKDMGLITPAEFNALARVAARNPEITKSVAERYSGASQEIKDEEAVAHFFERLADGRVKLANLSTWQKIKDFIRDIGHVLTGGAVQQSERGLVKDVAQGKPLNRKVEKPAETQRFALPNDGMSDADHAAAAGKQFAPENDEENRREYNKIAKTLGGKIINVDEARELYAPYAASDEARSRLSPVIHSAIGPFIDRMIKDRLKQEATGPVLLLAGGGGSGKSHVQDNEAVARRDRAEFVIDGTMKDYEKTKALITDILKSERPVDLVYVHTDPQIAAERAFGRARSVPPHVLGGAHAGANDAILRLAPEYAGKPDVSVTFFDANGKNAREITLAEMQGNRHTPIGGSLQATAERLTKIFDAERVKREAANESGGDRRLGGRRGAVSGVDQGTERALPPEERAELRGDRAPESRRDGEAPGDEAAPDVGPKFAQAEPKKNLANPGLTADTRKLVNEVDDVREMTGEPGTRKDSTVNNEAEARFKKNPDAERRKLLETIRNGGQLNDTETVIAHHLINRDGLKALSGTNPDDLAAVQALIWAYRQAGSVQARAFRQRRDRMASPEERLTNLIQAILSPPSKITEKVKELFDDGEAQQANKIMETWAKKQREVVKGLKAQGVDLEDLALPEKLTDPLAMARTLNRISTLRSRWGDMVMEFWIHSILSGPTTQIVNLTSNVAATAWEHALQRPVNALISQIPGFRGKKDAQTLGELRLVYTAMLKAMPRAMVNAYKSFQAETDILEFSRDVQAMDHGGKLENYRGPAIPGPVGRVIRTPGRALVAADSLLKTILAHAEVTALAYRRGKAEGLTGKELQQHIVDELGDPQAQVWEDALVTAKELTFQKDLKGKIGSNLSKMRGYELPGGIKPLAFVLPFVRTPWNIFAIGLRKSPLGSISLAAKVLRKGIRAASKNDDGTWDYSARQMASDLSEQLVAWSAVAALFGMAQPGDEDDEDPRPFITGSGTGFRGDRGKREYEQRAEPPTSIRIGNEWYNYGRIEPFATALSAMVDLARVVGSDESISGKAAETFSKVIGQVRNKTFLAGVSDILNVATDPDQNAERYVTGFAASWVPNLIRQPLRASQENVPEMKHIPKIEGDTEALISMRRLGQTVLPLETLGPSPKVDVWGREIPRYPVAQTSFMGRMMRGLSPVQSRQDMATEADLWLRKWNDAHPEDDYWPLTPPAYRTIKGKRVEYTEDEYHDLMQDAGKLALDEIKASGLLNEAPTEDSVKDLKKILERARREAREGIADRRGEDDDGTKVTTK